MGGLECFPIGSDPSMFCWGYKDINSSAYPAVLGPVLQKLAAGSKASLPSHRIIDHTCGYYLKRRERVYYISVCCSKHWESDTNEREDHGE